MSEPGLLGPLCALQHMECTCGRRSRKSSRALASSQHARGGQQRPSGPHGSRRAAGSSFVLSELPVSGPSPCHTLKTIACRRSPPALPSAAASAVGSPWPFVSWLGGFGLHGALSFIPLLSFYS